jgi:hypothetical protein
MRREKITGLKLTKVHHGRVWGRQPEHVVVDQHLPVKLVDRRVQRGPTQAHINATVPSVRVEEGKDVADLGGNGTPNPLLGAPLGDGLTVGVTQQEPNLGAFVGAPAEVLHELGQLLRREQGGIDPSTSICSLAPPNRLAHTSAGMPARCG